MKMIWKRKNKLKRKNKPGGSWQSEPPKLEKHAPEGFWQATGILATTFAPISNTVGAKAWPIQKKRKRIINWRNCEFKYFD